MQMSAPFLRCLGRAAVVCLAGVGCNHAVSPQSLPQKPLPTLEASVLTVQPQRWPILVRTQGSLLADEIAVIGAKVAGRVAEVHVDLGDSIKAGEALVTLDQRELILRVSQADAQLSQARSAIGLKPDGTLDQLKPQEAPPVRQEFALWEEAKTNVQRMARLRTQNATSQAEYEQVAAAERVAEAKYSAALNAVYEKIALIGVREAELGLARQQVQDAVIRASFDGLVEQRYVGPGAYVQIGSPVANLVRTNPLRFRGMVPERRAQDLKIGQQVRLRIESVAEPLSVTVTRISPALDPHSRSLLFEAEIDNSDQKFRTGLFAEAEIVLVPNATALIVPHSALIEFAGAEKVWKVVNGMAGEQEVLTGQRRPEGVEILSGLAVGDVILWEASKGRVAAVKALHKEQDSLARQNADTSADGAN